jgi:hypothetical protein
MLRSAEAGMSGKLQPGPNGTRFGAWQVASQKIVYSGRECGMLGSPGIDPSVCTPLWRI